MSVEKERQIQSHKAARRRTEVESNICICETSL